MDKGEAAKEGIAGKRIMIIKMPKKEMKMERHKNQVEKMKNEEDRQKSGR